MTWLHNPPRPAPPMPPHVNLEGLMGEIAKTEAAGQGTPASAYLRVMCPVQQQDKWGQPLPLSDVDQDKVDRLFAVLVDPHGRTQKLLRSGLLLEDETDAVKTAFPEVYTVLAEETLRDLMASVPPFQEWAENAIGVLFGVPPAQLLASPAPAQPAPAPKKPKSAEPTPDMSGTAADRRDIGVRKELR